MYSIQESWPPRRKRRSEQRNRRRFVRVGTTIRGYIAQNFRLAECEILDLSLGGARVRADESLGDQARITLGFGRFGMIEGEVVWRRQGVMGLKYVDSPQVIQQTLSGFLPRHCLAS